MSDLGSLLLGSIAAAHVRAAFGDQLLRPRPRWPAGLATSAQRRRLQRARAGVVVLRELRQLASSTTIDAQHEQSAAWSSTRRAARFLREKLENLASSRRPLTSESRARLRARRGRPVKKSGET